MPILLSAWQPDPEGHPLTDAEALALGRFLVAFNVLDFAMEDAIMFFWRVAYPTKFREAFFKRMASGAKHELLWRSKYREPWFEMDWKRIGFFVELRNTIAHNLPATDYTVEKVEPYQSGEHEDEEWHNTAVFEFPIFETPKSPIAVAGLDAFTTEVREITGRIRQLEDRVEPDDASDIWVDYRP